MLVLAFFLLAHYVNIKRGILNLGISKGYISLKKVDYKFYREGKLDYEIFAKGLSYSSPKKNIISLDNIRAYIYGKTGKREYVITGKRGSLNAATRNVTVSGDVRIKDFKGSFIKTGLIYFIAKENKILAPDYIKIKSKNYYISGYGLVFNIKENVFVMHKKVHFVSSGTGR